ncbi:bifunctional lytic transglycosylase/C40 family peptidase [Actinacidiphila yeochonensis]|uniref:bifunctional lytic transglycosylase/C40 family peptidase n=1 Tax=Actinacidiphila yeochonensis TaxID=89050 RepID=UPI000569A892|nr:bifunctional lytic transglycosylase/C40 family peptidase [Actinacidiphila yeochonensis]
MSSLFAKAAGTVGCAVLALPVLAALVVATLLDSLTTGNDAAAAPSKSAVADIPPAMLTIYRQAAPECPGLSWTILAAIGKVETDHARIHTMVSTAGAVGPMQFLPATFAAYSHPVPPGGRRPATPWDPVDAVHAAARLLCANGARDGHDVRRAVFAYNHSTAYVNKVVAIAATYAAGEPAPARAGATAVAFAHSQLGAPYVWGGDGPVDGGFDCSGLTQAAYHAAAIALPRTAQAQYDAGPHLPHEAPLLPGDLLFYGTDPHHITHVALYTGNGLAIDAPHSGAVVRQGPARLNTPSFRGATRPAVQGAAG